MRYPAWRIATTGIQVLVLWLVLASARPALAQTGAGSYGASFLKIPVGARLMASPDAVAGMQPDASLMYSNPAFISDLESMELFVASSRWLGDLSFNSMGAGIPLGRSGTVLGIGTSLLYSGGLDGYDAALNVVGEESFYDLGIDVVLSHRFGASGFSAAAGATYVREHVLPDDGSGQTFHAGVSYRNRATLLHAAFRDLAGTINYPSGSWPIASEWIAGGGRIFNSSAGQFFTGLQAASSDAYGTRVRLGVDYSIGGLFTLRTGLNDNLDTGQAESRINAGLGMRHGAFAFEYAYTPHDYFASAHTFTLAYHFGAVTPGGAPGAIVPPGDLAPPLAKTTANSEPGRVTPPREGMFVLVGGAHGTLESAMAEARELEHVNIPVEIENEGPRFRVVVGRYATFDGAATARQRYRSMGYDLQILTR